MKQLSLLFTAVILTVPAWAVDGATLINQASVLASGGFPYTISQTGSYRLSSDLIVPCATALTGIVVNAPQVTLDMNGFTLSCSGGTNAATGIAVKQNNAVLSNGTITGFGGATRGGGEIEGWGVSILYPGGAGSGTRAKLDHMRITQNGNGVDSDSGSEVEITESSIDLNLGVGVSAVISARITNSAVRENRSYGIEIADGVITGSVIGGNAGGIYCTGGVVTITNNNFIDNSPFAIGAPIFFGGAIGYGLNTFGGNTTDVVTMPGFFSLKNNVGLNGLF
jgi:hypothetical protein